MEKTLSLKGFASQYFIEGRENSTPWNGLDDAIDDAIQAVLSKKDGSRKLVVVNIERNKIEVFDNGIGQTYNNLKEAFSNAVYHGWEENVGVGIKGIGRFKFASLCADFSSPLGSSYRIQSSVGDSIVTEIKMQICNHDDTLLSPTINDIKNELLEDNGINIINGKLQGTIISLSPAVINDTDFTPMKILHYGHRYHDNICYDGVELIINGKKIEPIDLPHISHITDDNINSVIYNKEGKFCSIYHRLEFFHKLNETKKLFFNVKATTALYSDELRKKYEWENLFKFNELSGVFVKFRGRYLNDGGNAGKMFRQNIETGDTKGKGKYGDVSGSYSAYNRLVIEFFDDDVAEIFGVKTVKSQGIQDLSENKKLFNDYFTIINGEKINVYDAICYIRNFLHEYIYSKVIKEYKLNKKNTTEKQWESFSTFCNYFYENYNFSTGKLKRGNKKTSIKDIEYIFGLSSNKSSKIIKNEINNEKCFINAKWEETSNDEVLVTQCEINEQCDLFNFINDNNINEILFKEFKDDLTILINECKFPQPEIQRFLIAKTKFKLKKYKKIFS